MNEIRQTIAWFAEENERNRGNAINDQLCHSRRSGTVKMSLAREGWRSFPANNSHPASGSSGKVASARRCLHARDVRLIKADQTHGLASKRSVALMPGGVACTTAISQAIPFGLSGKGFVGSGVGDVLLGVWL